jgi:RNA polymerase sigma-70 factor, ECF subfamily
VGIVRGEPSAAIHDIYVENVDCVYGFLCRRVGPQAAQDLTAETFCRAVAALGSYEERGVPIRAWLLRIAYHLIVGESRKKRPTPIAITEETSPVSHRDVSTDAVNRMEAAVLMDALASLSDKQRGVIDLRFIQDLSVSECAVVLNTNEDAIRALTYRALRSLRQAHHARWQPGEGDDGTDS